jgi:CubicO group peptidase (beta-lactamase class C family)
MDRSLVSLLVATLLVLGGCDPDLDPETDFRGKSCSKSPKFNKHIYPGQDWKRGKPQHHGLSPQGLAEMAQLAEELDSTCLMVIHDGVVVKEWYAPGYGPNTIHENLFSVTKSVTSTLVGIATEEEMLELDDSASEYINPWLGSPSEEVTVRNLLSNDSGRFWSFESDYMNMMVLPDQTGYAIGLDQAIEPAAYWEYNNAAIQTLEAVLEQATGDDVESFAQEHLFDRIGMDATMTRDAVDNPLVYQGLQTSCADIARFGYLILREGKWKNEQVVPAQWVAQATTPSTGLNSAYGFLWWLNRDGHVVEPSFPNRIEYDGQLVPAASENLHLAAGAFGQFVAIDPEGEYVVVRLQDVLDIQATLAADPDPVGLSKIEALMTAFEEAKD